MTLSRMNLAVPVLAGKGGIVGEMEVVWGLHPVVPNRHGIVGNGEILGH